MKETPFSHALRVALNAPFRLTRVWRINSGSISFIENGRRYHFEGAPEGTADLCGIVRGGLYIEIETKASKGTKRKSQELRHSFINGAGGVHVFISPSVEDLDSAVRIAVGVIDAKIRATRPDYPRNGIRDDDHAPRYAARGLVAVDVGCYGPASCSCQKCRDTRAGIP